MCLLCDIPLLSCAIVILFGLFSSRNSFKSRHDFRENAEGEEQKETTEVEQAAKDDEELIKGPEEMTLDEWKAKQSAASKKKQFKIRKPGEGNFRCLFFALTPSSFTDVYQVGTNEQPPQRGGAVPDPVVLWVEIALGLP